jgi:hypothetical protein
MSGYLQKIDDVLRRAHPLASYEFIEILPKKGIHASGRPGCTTYE